MNFLNQLIFHEIIIYFLSRIKKEDVKEEGKERHAENIHQKKNKIQEENNDKEKGVRKQKKYIFDKN